MVQYACPLQDRGGRAGGTLSELSIYNYAVGIILAAVGVGQIEPILMLD